MELPTYLQYGDMLKMNPWANFQAQKQVDLANQFQQEKLLQEQNDTRAKALANMFTEQDNPLRLQERTLTNEQKDVTNRNLGVTTRINEQTEGLQLNAKQRELLKSVAMSDLEALQAHAEAAAMSPDPNIRAQGAQALQWTKTFRQEKMKEEGLDRRNQATIQGHITTTAMNNKSQKELEQMRIDAGKYSKSGVRVTVETQLIKAKTAREKAEILEAAYFAAQAGGDEEGAQGYLSRLQQARQRAAEDANNTALGKPGAVDPAALANLPAAPRAEAGAGIPGSNTQPPGTGAVRVRHPDGRVGTIPANRLKEALAAGYSEVK